MLFFRFHSIKSELKRWGRTNFLNEIYHTSNFANLPLALLKNAISPAYDYRFYNGYDPIYVSPEQQKIFARVLARNTDRTCDTDLERNEIFNYYLNKLDYFCKENNIQLIILTSPEYRDYCNYDNNLFSELLSKRGIIYFDYTHYFGDDSALKYWKDLNHLSHEGAKIFTQKVKEDLSKKGIIK